MRRKAEEARFENPAAATHPATPARGLFEGSVCRREVTGKPRKHGRTLL